MSKLVCVTRRRLSILINVAYIPLIVMETFIGGSKY